MHDMDWRVKTPTIAGPMEGAGVPWPAVGAIALTSLGVFYAAYMTTDSRLLSVGIAFAGAFTMWVFASLRTRQDRDWAVIFGEKIVCRTRMIAMYLWNKYNFGWPA